MYRIILIPLAILCLMNCSSNQRINQNRLDDAKDIVNLSMDKKVYGLLFIFIIPIGIQHASEGEGEGIRFGHLGKFQYGESIPWDRDYKHGNNLYIIHSSLYHSPIEENRRGKTCKLSYFIEKYKSNITGMKECRVYPTIEFSIGLYYGFRVGVNPIEAIDFLTGLFGYDLLEDDLQENQLYVWEYRKQLKLKKEEQQKLKAKIQEFNSLFNKHSSGIHDHEKYFLLHPEKSILFQRRYFVNGEYIEEGYFLSSRSKLGR
ncbi:MAG: hypothetical protein SFU98_11350 [Leptospiraceae bacterium]|nr:hypothetical protein [Leptospiraceae bacterium]